MGEAMKKWLGAAAVVMFCGGSQHVPPSPDSCAIGVGSVLGYMAQEMKAAEAAMREDGGRMTAQGRHDMQISVARIGRYADSILASIMQEEFCGGEAGVDPTRRPNSDPMMWVLPGTSVMWLDGRRGRGPRWPPQGSE